VLALPVPPPLKYRELVAGMREAIARGIFMDEISRLPIFDRDFSNSSI